MADQSKKIRVSSVKRNQYGLSVGEKNGNDWTNYYCNDESVCQVLEAAKGSYAFISYHQNQKGNLIITGATADDQQQAGGGGQKSGCASSSEYNMQNCVKAAAQVLTGNSAIQTDSAKDIGEFVGTVAKAIYDTCYAKNPLDDMVKKAQEVLDATPEPNPDDDIPF